VDLVLGLVLADLGGVSDGDLCVWRCMVEVKIVW